MATIVIDSPVIEKPVGRIREHLFFGAMSGAVALIVFIGFARTYYLAGIFGAKPLAAPIVHVHVVFVELGGFVIGHTAAWHAFAVHVQSIGA